MFDVRDARVVVTGAASGLGFAIAEVMADCGAQVTLADLDEGSLERAAGELEGPGGRVRTFRLDVSDAERVDALFDDVVEAQGGVDVVFANAGISLEPGFGELEGGLAKVGGEAWERVLAVDLDGVIFTMRADDRARRARGAVPEGRGQAGALARASRAQEAARRGAGRVIEVEDLTVRFGGVTPLEGMTVRFPEGTCGLIGPNGAGKTTFFNVLSGFVRPAGGRVRAFGADLLSMADYRRARWGLRRTFQTEQAIEELSVFDNVAMVHEH
jgi:NAD(P)-dependent dehydrogenase (short-subunit alcohol dehydrogenase family)